MRPPGVIQPPTITHPDTPFRTLWNSAWPSKCGAAAAAAARIGERGIDVNPGVAREGSDAVCTPGPDPKYNLGQGLYPSYHCTNGFPMSEANCQAINGGSPQLGDLAAHEEAWRRDIARLLPDSAARTVINLD